MKKKYKRLPSSVLIITILILVLSGCFSGFQSVMEEKMTTNLEDKVYSQKEIEQDLDFFVETMYEVCPFPYLNTDSVYIANLVDKIKKEGAKNGRELYLNFMELSASFKTGHIFTIPPTQMLEEYFEKGGKVFPLSLTKQKGKWIIENVMDTAFVALKDKFIHEINGVEVNSLIASFEPKMYSETGKIDDMIGSEIAFLMWLKGVQAPFNISFSDSFSSKKQQISLVGANLLEHVKKQKQEEQLSDYITFEMLPENIGYLNLKSFVIFDRGLMKSYNNFIENAFTNLKNNKVDQLIIDLRDNSGGRGQLAEEVLSYIANKPYQQSSGEIRRVSHLFKDYLNEIPWVLRKITLKQAGLKGYFDMENGSNLENFSESPESLRNIENRFEGRVWCLIGSGTYSAAMMMANAIEDYELGTLVGEPTGGIPNELSDVLPVKTPNSKIAFMTPSALFIRANGDASNTNPVMPDILVESNKENSINERDLVLDRLLKLIVQNN